MIAIAPVSRWHHQVPGRNHISGHLPCVHQTWAALTPLELDDSLHRRQTERLCRDGLYNSNQCRVNTPYSYDAVCLVMQRKACLAMAERTGMEHFS